MRCLVRHVLFRQGGFYGLIGLLQLGVDWLVYVLLTGLGISVVPANVTARICGAGLGFTLNGLFTFRDHEGARLGWRRLAKFVSTWCVTTVFSSLALSWIETDHGLGISWVAKPAVDVVLAGLSFVASRHWIYR